MDLSAERKVYQTKENTKPLADAVCAFEPRRLRETGVVNGEYIDDCYAVKLGFDGQELARINVSGSADSLAVGSGTVYIYDAMSKMLKYTAPVGRC